MSHANPQVEGWVIGALLDADGPVLRTSCNSLLEASGLVADDFTRPDLRAYFQAITTLSGRNRPTDAQTVLGVASGMPQVPKDAWQALSGLQASNSANRAAFIAHAEELRRLSLLRRLESHHRAQLEALTKPRPDPAALLQKDQTFVDGISATTEQDSTGEQDMVEILEDWDAFTQGKREPFLRTGIQVLDERLRGFVNNLNVVGGLPSIGKSAFMAEVVLNALKSGLKVGVFGLEDATKPISKRHLARAMNMSVGDVGAVRLHEHQQEHLAQVASNIANLTRNMVTFKRAGIDPVTLIQRCKHWILNLGVQAIFIDHGGEVRHESAEARDRHDLAVANTYRQLRDLAVNHRVPIVVLCHFTRETEKNGAPTQRSFAETAYIERMARVALGLWERPEEPGQLLCTVLKCTEGERGYTLWLGRDRRPALVNSVGGGVVDLEAESRAAEENRKSEKRSRMGDWRKGSGES